MKYGRIGVVGRFRPLHKGSGLLLKRMCEQAEHVVIGIGSSNRYNFRNPFTANEVHQMIDAYLGKHHSNYEVTYIPDFGHEKDYSDGQRWKQEILRKFPTIEGFVSGNPWTNSLLGDTYTVIPTEALIPEDTYAYLHGTPVRLALVTNQDWESHVPQEVVSLIKTNKWDDRVQREFGSEIVDQGFAHYTDAKIERENISLGGRQ